MAALSLKRNQVIVFEGDSLTGRRGGPSLDNWPFLRLMNWHHSWADEVAHLLFCWRPELNLTFHNAAVGGSTCRGVMGRLETMVLPHKPDWVLMTLGGNDSRIGIPKSEFRSTLIDYARRLREVNPRCRVLFVGGFRAGPHYPKAKGARMPKRWEYYSVLRRVARSTGGAYVDAGSGMYRAAVELHRQHAIHTVYSDGGHFNAVGNLVVAGEVLKAFGVVARWPKK